MLGQLRVTLGRPANTTDLAAPLDLTLQLARLAFRSVYPGGDDTCSIEWDWETAPGTHTLPLPPERVGFGHVTVLDGATPIWEGRLVDLALAGGRVVGIRAEGYQYALEDGWLEAAGAESDRTVTAYDLVVEAVRQSTALVTTVGLGEAQDPGGAYAPGAFDGMTAKAIVEQLCHDGDGTSLWAYTVYGRRLVFARRVAPAMPAYVVPADGSLRTFYSVKEVYGAAAAPYTDGSALQYTARVKHVGFQHRYGFERARLLGGGERSSAGAYRAAATFVATHNEPVVTATLDRGGGRLLETAGGGLMPAWHARAGEWVEIEGLGSLPIIALDASYAPGALVDVTLDLGEVADHVPSRRGERRASRAAVAKLAANVQPVAGGPTRRLRRGQR